MGINGGIKKTRVIWRGKETNVSLEEKREVKEKEKDKSKHL